MTAQNPKVGVVVPIFNVAPYLRECLDSIQNQSFENFQAVLVNDGSTDESLQIALEYVKKDSRFVLIDTTNRGVSAARNTGIAWFCDEIMPEIIRGGGNRELF
ncbi:glycosyltransferase family 2 protein [Helicobacter himalayensis]|uniref:glycosyltransferase family 2 protein n=1 Tax=Helicobacter himalayensis TaxID=1591088 RepID=UPI003D700F2E